MQLISHRTLFFIRAYNDLDHFSPVIAEFVKRGENPLVINYGGLEISEDYRVKYLNSLGAIDIRNMPDLKFVSSRSRKTFSEKIRSRLYELRRRRKGIIGRLHRRLFFDYSAELKFLSDNRVGACVFEWGTPFIRGDLIEQFFIAAKSIGLKTVVIPHGCNVFVNSDVTSGYRRLFSRGQMPDNSDRNLYDYYVLQNPLRRDGWVKWGYDPVKTQAWGSPRFYPLWAKMNASLCPQYTPSFDTSSRLKIVFMQFQKDYNINKDEIKLTLEALSSNPTVCLVVKDSTRAGKEYFDKSRLSGELGESLVEWCGNEVHSPSLIEWADCVIVFGSSIGMEVILQDKLLINPLFLHTNKTLYEYFGASHDAASLEELNQLIDSISRGNVVNDKQAIDSLIREIVFAGGDSYDVPALYYDKITAKYLEYT